MSSRSLTMFCSLALLAAGAAHADDFRTRLSDNKAEFSNPGGGATKVTLGEAETVFSQRVETGLQFAPVENFDLRLSAAANHVNADTKSSDPNLALVGLSNTEADVRSHWDYPVELAAVWNFR